MKIDFCKNNLINFLVTVYPLLMLN